MFGGFRNKLLRFGSEIVGRQIVPTGEKMKLSNFFSKLECDVSGATAVEYGLILALIFLAILGSIQGVASSTVQMWNDVAAAMID